MAQELLYTSAPQGLKAGGRGFCTVEATAGMSPALAAALEGLSGYRHVAPAGDPANPVVRSHVTFALGGRTYSVVSRVADAGTDYTGRTNKIAHHLALDPTERPKGGPAWLLGRPETSRATFDGEPKTLPPRTPPAGDRPPGVCVAWQAAAGDAGWAGVLAEAFLADPTRPAYLVVPPGLDVRPLFEEAIALLPPDRRWSATFTTCFTSLPQNVNCLWRAVLAGSKEAHESRRFVQALRIDLTTSLGSAHGGPLPGAARSGRLPVAAIPVRVQPAVSVGIVTEPTDLLDEMPLTAAPSKPKRFTDTFVSPPDLPPAKRRTRLWLGLSGITLLLIVTAGASTWFVSRRANSPVKTVSQVPPNETSVAVAEVEPSPQKATNHPDVIAATEAPAIEEGRTEEDGMEKDAAKRNPGVDLGKADHDTTTAAGTPSPTGETKDPTSGGDAASAVVGSRDHLQRTATGNPMEDPASPPVKPQAEQPTIGRLSLIAYEQDQGQPRLKLYRVEGFDAAFAFELTADRKDTFRLWPPKWSGGRYHIDGSGTPSLHVPLSNRQSVNIAVSDNHGRIAPELWVEATSTPEGLLDVLRWSLLTVESGPKDSPTVRRYLLSTAAASLPAGDRRLGRDWPLPAKLPFENGEMVDPGFYIHQFVIRFEGEDFLFRHDGQKLVSDGLGEFIAGRQTAESLKIKVRNNPPTIRWSVKDDKLSFTAYPGGGYDAILKDLENDEEIKRAKSEVQTSSPSGRTFGPSKFGWAALFSQIDNRALTAALAEEIGRSVVADVEAFCGQKVAGVEEALKAKGADETGLQAQRAGYEAAERHVKDQVNRIVGTLKQRESLNSSLVVAARIAYPVLKDDGGEWSVELIGFDDRQKRQPQP